MATVNYSFNLPTVGGDDDVWGDLLNANWTALDTQLFSGTIGADTTGNADTATLATDATTLATPRDFTIGATTRSFDGSANVTWSLGDIGIVLADQAEAQAGTDDAKFMTPLRTAEAIAALTPPVAQLTQGQAEDPASTVFGTVSGQRLAQAFDAREQPIGVDQTWQDVSASRSTDTIYQNTTGRAIMVALRFGQNTNRALEVSPDGSAGWVSTGDSTTGAGLNAYAIVPDGHYYRQVGSNNNLWAELR